MRELEEAARRIGAAPSFDLAARAGREGLLDVAYDSVDTPFGAMLVAVSQRGLARVAFRPEDPEEVLEQLARLISPRILCAPKRIDPVRRELDAYFAGRRREFGVRLDWTLVGGFARRVLEATARIPYGRVSTYREVARRAGNPRAMRAAGNALGANPIPIVVPCHRVVRTGGAIGNYGGGADMKRALLVLEGALDA